MPPDAVADYVSTARRIIGLVKSERVFKILVLLALFRGCLVPMERVRERYLRLLERETREGVTGGGDDRGGVAVTMRELMGGLDDVEKFTVMMTKMLGQDAPSSNGGGGKPPGGEFARS